MHQLLHDLAIDVRGDESAPHKPNFYSTVKRCWIQPYDIDSDLASPWRRNLVFEFGNHQTNLDLNPEDTHKSPIRLALHRLAPASEW